MAEVSITVNGKTCTADVEPRMLLVHFLREQLDLTGTHVGCDTSQCGACTVLVDGRSAKSCTLFAVQVDGSRVTTIEGLAEDGRLHPLQDGFWEEHGLQCGYCTPGMIMSAVNLLADNAAPTEQEIRDGLDGNFCRCTGYQHIVNAVQRAAGEEVIDGLDPDVAKAGRSARQATRGPASHSGARHVCRRREARRAPSPGLQAERRGARPHPGRGRQRGPGDGGSGCRLHRRGDRRVPGFRCPSGRHFRLHLIAPSRTRSVRYVGEPVAVVVACDRYVARDAVDAIVVEYEPLAGGRRPRGGG